MSDVIWTELRYSVRGLARTPVFTLVAVLSLALAVGANTAVFSVVSGLQLRPLPYREADRLVDIYEHHPTQVCAGCGVGTSYPTYLHLRGTTRSLQAVAAYRSESITVGLRDGAERWRGAYVSALVFPLLGIQPLHGRGFTADEDAVGGSRVVVIGERLWRARFGGSADVVGRTVRVNGEPRTIIGIMPNALAFPPFAELWLPIAPTAAGDTRANRNIAVIGRLADEVSLEGARGEMAALGARLALEEPQTHVGWSMHVAPLRAEMTADYVTSFYLMLGILAFVLLIACANLANLLLARASARRHELGVRVALGASRLALARHMLAESLLLSCTGAALGLLMASWALDAFTAVINDALPAWVHYDIDIRVALFASTLGILTGAGFGLLPALQVARTPVNATLANGARGTPGGRAHTRVRNASVALQVTAAMVLVFGAGFFT